VSYVIEPPPRASIAVASNPERFAVRRVFCVGRNYASHAREMGHDPEREAPFFFNKPADAVVDAAPDAGARIVYPPQTQQLDHEIELAVALASGGTDVQPDDALGLVFGYAPALDLTRRDLQRAAKEKGRPWAWAKAFDASLPIAPLRPVADVGHPAAGRIWLRVDGTERQSADLSELIWSVSEVIAQISRSMRLAAGDVILTGTPSGVGPIAVGQTVRAGIDGLGELEVAVVASNLS
jgi:fumarylpyruvate hydrolase